MQFPGGALRRRRRLHDRLDPESARDHPPSSETPAPDLSRRHAAGRGARPTAPTPARSRRGALAPVSTAPAAGSQPVQTASAPPCSPIDDTTTGTVPSPSRAMAEQGDVKGWSRAGGTRVTVKEGETVYNLSRRFGVPADVIMKSNGLTESDGLKAGPKIVIPTYVYSDKAPVSAPDNNPKTAKAKSSRGENRRPTRPRSRAEPRGAAADAEGKERSRPRRPRRRPTTARPSRAAPPAPTRCRKATRCRASPGRPASASPPSRRRTASTTG